MWLTTIVIKNRFSDRFAGTFCRIIFMCLKMSFCFFVVVFFCSQYTLQCAEKTFIQIVDLTMACFKIQDKKVPGNNDLEK